MHATIDAEGLPFHFFRFHAYKYLRGYIITQPGAVHERQLLSALFAKTFCHRIVHVKPCIQLRGKVNNGTCIKIEGGGRAVTGRFQAHIIKLYTNRHFATQVFCIRKTQ